MTVAIIVAVLLAFGSGWLTGWIHCVADTRRIEEAARGLRGRDHARSFTHTNPPPTTRAPVDWPGEIHTRDHVDLPGVRAGRTARRRP